MCKSISNQSNDSLSVCDSLRTFSNLCGSLRCPLGQQQDAQEWMNMILDQLYSGQNEEGELQIAHYSPFRIDSKTSGECDNCTYHFSKKATESMLTLELSEEQQHTIYSYQESDGRLQLAHTNLTTSINELINIPRLQKGESCPSCNADQVERSTVLNNCSDYLILHLKFFHLSQNWNLYKLMPNLSVKECIQVEVTDDELNKSEIGFKLHSIVLHTGETVTGGHYVSIVKMNNNWFLTNDTQINSWIPKKMFQYENGLEMYPYVLVYKKC